MNIFKTINRFVYRGVYLKLKSKILHVLAHWLFRQIRFGSCDIARSINLHGANPRNQYDITVPFYIFQSGFKVQYEEVDAWLVD